MATTADHVAASSRAYDSPVRRRQAADTRERIVAAGSALVHELPSWSWANLTVRAVAERAGVSERTVYRQFACERELRDAVMRRLEQEAGVDLVGLRTSDLPATAGRVFRFLSELAITPSEVDNPTFDEVDRRKRAALRDAVETAAPGWADDDRELAAAVLDVLWSVPTYERLVGAWDLDPERAASAVGWVMRLVESALDDDRRPVHE